MRLKVPFLGYALAGVAFLLPSIVLTAFIPFLINAQPMRAKLVREIGNWTGGEVKLAGSISVQDFFSLSVEANDVEIGRFKAGAAIEGIKAESVVARIAWFNLLSGNFNFDKIKVSRAVVKMRASGLADAGQLLSDFVTGPQDAPFEALVLEDSVIALRSGQGKPYRRLHVPSALARTARRGSQLIGSARLIWKDRPANLSVRTAFHLAGETHMPLRLMLDSDLLSGVFEGKAVLAGPADAEGALDFRSPDLAAAARWLEVDIGPVAIARSVSASGDFTMTPEQVTLIGGTVSVAGQVAQAALTVKRGGHVPRVEGVLAFNTFDMTPLLAGPPDIAAPVAKPKPFRIPLESDLRISAKTVSWNGIEAGPAAMTVTAKPEQLKAEIAELGFLGGDVRGHIGLDMTGVTPRATARLTGDTLDAAGFLRLAGQSDWLTGAADVNVEAEANVETPGQIGDRLVARARVNFPEGGGLRLDLPRLATAALGETSGWDALDLTGAAFERLRFDLSMQNGQISFANVLLAAAGQQLNGRGEINMAGRSLDWRFLVQPASETARDGRDAPVSDASVPGSRLSITGPWATPTIRRDAPAPISATDRMKIGDRAAGLEVSLSQR